MNDSAVPSINYFELLGIEQSYGINISELDLNYLELQKKWHPDLYPDGVIKDKAKQKTSLINNAYVALGFEISRAQHLLELNNFVKPSDSILEPEFLELQFELRENIEQAFSQDDEKQICKILTRAESEFSDINELLNELFATKPLDVYKIHQYIMQMQFWDKIINDVSEHEIKKL
jgi:molecular chaperone HscB